MFQQFESYGVILYIENQARPANINKSTCVSVSIGKTKRNRDKESAGKAMIETAS